MKVAVDPCQAPSLQTAVLFLVFNRPETTRVVFEAIRMAKPPRLYVAADGPREGRAEEGAKVAMVRDIATQVDWPCDLKMLFREKNLGCKDAVSSAITWFFEHENEGIILEDDILPSRGFFEFCEEMLDRYRACKSVGMISGTNLLPSELRGNESYFFSKHALIWGWATWRDRWERYDKSLSQMSPSVLRNKLANVSDGNGTFFLYWVKIFNNVRVGKIGTWDFQWSIVSFYNEWTNVVPSFNLVKNIGFGGEGTHTYGFVPDYISSSTIEEISRPYVHPDENIRDAKLDSAIDDYSLPKKMRCLVSYLISTLKVRWA